MDCPRMGGWRKKASNKEEKARAGANVYCQMVLLTLLMLSELREVTGIDSVPINC